MSIFQYRIIAAPKKSTYTEKKSKFIAYAFHCDTVEAVHDRLDQIKKVHHKARHHCYGYRLGLDKNNFRANDDGEPSGTAGKPILGQIDSHQLTNTLIIVVRYFGGVKLGVSGLISAYRAAAKDVLQKCSILEKEVTKKVKIKVDFLHIGILLTNAKKLGFEILNTNYDPSPLVELLAPLENYDQRLIQLKAQTLNMSEDQAEIHTENDVFHILDDE